MQAVVEDTEVVGDGVEPFDLLLLDVFFMRNTRSFLSSRRRRRGCAESNAADAADDGALFLAAWPDMIKPTATRIKSFIVECMVVCFGLVICCCFHRMVWLLQSSVVGRKMSCRLTSILYANHDRLASHTYSSRILQSLMT